MTARVKHAKALGYPKELRTPIFKESPKLMRALLGTDKVSPTDASRDEFFAKISVLIAHYEIDPEDENRFVVLAFRLAHDWIPGFEVIETKSKIGAPRKHSAETDRELVRLVDALVVELRAQKRSKRDCSVIAACRKLLKSPSVHRRWQSMTPAALKNRYLAARRQAKRTEQVFEAIFKPTMFQAANRAPTSAELARQKSEESSPQLLGGLLFDMGRGRR